MDNTTETEHREDNRKSTMDHIERNHMLRGKQGKSIFLATNRCDVWAMIEETLTNPDSVSVHRSKTNKRIYKKNFVSAVGLNGFSGAWCYAVTVIYDTRNNQIVTAFPSVSS